jgi:hypothetical protein
MASRHKELLDAMVTAINAGTYTVGAVTSSRKNKPRFDREDIDALTVVLAPASEERGPYLSRKKDHLRTLGASVFIAAPADVDVNTDSDSYMELADEIKAELIAADPLLTGLQITGIAHEEPAGADDYAESLGLFLTEIVVSYEEVV